MNETIERAMKERGSGLGDLLPSFVRTAFSALSETQTEEAKRGLESYMAAQLKETPLTATIETTSNIKDQLLALQCSFHGTMSPAEYRELEQQLIDTLAAHPAFANFNPVIKCEQKPDGKVTLQANLVGLSARDYSELMQSLADQQQVQETFDTTSARRDGAHHLEEKLHAAAANLKTLMSRDLVDKENFDIRVEKKESKKHTGKFTLDVRLENIAAPAKKKLEGALRGAFRRKSRRGMASGSDEVNGGELFFSDSGLVIDGLSYHGVEDLIDRLAMPISIHSGGWSNKVSAEEAQPVTAVLEKKH